MHMMMILITYTRTHTYTRTSIHTYVHTLTHSHKELWLLRAVFPYLHSCFNYNYFQHEWGMYIYSFFAETLIPRVPACIYLSCIVVFRFFTSLAFLRFVFFLFSVSLSDCLHSWLLRVLCSLRLLLLSFYRMLFPVFFFLFLPQSDLRKRKHAY